MSKTKPKKQTGSAAQALFDAEFDLRAAAVAMADPNSSDDEDTRAALQGAALAFADAWNACGSRK